VVESGEAGRGSQDDLVNQKLGKKLNGSTTDREFALAA